MYGIALKSSVYKTVTEDCEICFNLSIICIVLELAVFFRFHARQFGINQQICLNKLAKNDFTDFYLLLFYKSNFVKCRTLFSICKVRSW